MGKDTIQLKCKTQDVCLSMGGDCGVNRRDMVNVKVSDENELTKEMANLLWDCWWMMGEGKVDYMPAKIGFGDAYCSICYKVYFDEKIQEKYKLENGEGGISYKKVFDYMKANKIPDKDETYLFSIYKFNSMDPVHDALLKKEIDIYTYKLDPKKEYVVMTAITEGSWGAETIGTAAGAVGGAIIGSVWGGPLGTVGGWKGGAIAGGLVGLWIGSKTENFQHLAPNFVSFTTEEMNEVFNCKEYVSEG